ncbi:MAG: ABC transporter permease [Erysipelotrichaceae bacterium]|jgi:oligopeptide transport system permease protein|nr:ABC transporter permease [Bacillota bacterium]NLP21230.1 ABC transporter permease [Erysipelotrichaceae bacterium]
MKKYIWTRLLKSIISILIVVSIVVIMLYTLIPVSKIFENDPARQKLKTNYKTVYTYSRLEDLGYLDYYTIGEMCLAKDSQDINACITAGSDENIRVLNEFEADGFTVEKLQQFDEMQGNSIAYRYYGVLELLGNFYKKLIVIDHPFKIHDPKNPDMERGYSIGLDHNNVPAIKCSGCEYKYQLYFNTSFPFIHTNALKLNFGISYPTNAGVPTMDVISTGQGTMDSFEQTFPTGEVLKSPILQHTCKYKYETDHLDQKRFDDNYANCALKYDSPSMIQTSYIFGISSLILAYLISLPYAIAMARNKGKFVDKSGIVLINILIAVPSLALIFFVKYIGFAFGMPDKFPQLGFTNIKSYILPIIILALLTMPSLMMWVRRYMVDQSNADYVKFAKAKGLSKKEISRNHILKNAIIPIVNGLPSSIILAISGAVITESVFSIPGMGKMLPDAIKSTNNNMVITLTFIFTSLSILSVFLGDLLMTFVDPRISLNVKEGDK